MKKNAVEGSKSVEGKRSLTSTRVLAEMAIMIALSGALNLVIIFTLPQGGSVTLGAMIPVLLFSLRRGPKLGILAGAIFGLIVLVERPFIYHPVQLLLDYPLAFAALGLAGFLSKNSILGVAVGIAGRFLAHFVSGIVFFASYAPAGWNPAIYSLVYNGSYLGVEFIISGIVIFGLLKRGILKLYH